MTDGAQSKSVSLSSSRVSCVLEVSHPSKCCHLSINAQDAGFHDNSGQVNDGFWHFKHKWCAVFSASVTSSALGLYLKELWRKQLLCETKESWECWKVLLYYIKSIGKRELDSEMSESRPGSPAPHLHPSWNLKHERQRRGGDKGAQSEQ